MSMRYCDLCRAASSRPIRVQEGQLLWLVCLRCLRAERKGRWATLREIVKPAPIPTKRQRSRDKRRQRLAVLT